VAKHLKVLERADSLRAGASAMEPCRIEAAPLKNVSDWVEEYREIWEQRRIALVIPAELKEKEKKHGRKKRSLVEVRRTGRLSSRESTMAPRESVWDAWSDPQQVVHLWGPKDLRPPSTKWMCGPAASGGIRCTPRMHTILSKCFYRGRKPERIVYPRGGRKGVPAAI